MSGFSLPFNLAAPLDANLYCLGFFFFFFFCSDLMGGFDSGRLFSLSFSLAVPPNADLCVFCSCFCFSVVVVLVSCYGGPSVRRWWDGMWGVDGWVDRRWTG